MKPLVGLGKGCALQEVPFHTAAPALEPTASQKLADTQDTEAKPREPGMVCAVQDVPFHSHAPAPSVAELKPTASQKFAETHDTPDMAARVPLAAWTGSGVVWIFQEVPFHSSARLTEFPESSPWEPTASQK